MFGQTPTWIGFVWPNLMIAFLSDENCRAFISLGFHQLGTHSFIFTVLICVLVLVIWLRSCTQCYCSDCGHRRWPHSICVPSSAHQPCGAFAPLPIIFRLHTDILFILA